MDEPALPQISEESSQRCWTHRAAASALHWVHVWRHAHQARAAGIVLPPAVLVGICKQGGGLVL